MFAEINAAVNFLGDFLHDKLPRRKINLFSQQLANFLILRYKNAWNPAEPHKGTELRRIQVKVQGGITDSLISVTASNVGLEMEEVLQNWPDELTIWVDPGEVTYRVGERGPATIIYSASEDNNSLLNRLLNQNSGGLSSNGNSGLRVNLPDPVEQLSLALQHAKLQQDSAPVVQQQQQQQQQPNVQQQGAATNGNSGTGAAKGSAPTFELSSPNDIQFTVGSFAMTRFGTTKVKNTPATINRLRQKNRHDSRHHQFGGHHSSSSPMMSHVNGNSVATTTTVGGVGQTSTRHLSSGSSPLHFSAAPGARSQQSSLNSQIEALSVGNIPFSVTSTAVSTSTVGVASVYNNSPVSSNRSDDSDATCSPANDAYSPWFGLPQVRQGGGIWSGF